MLQKLNYNVCKLCCIIDSIEWLQRIYELQNSYGRTNEHAVYYIPLPPVIDLDTFVFFTT